MAGKHVWGITLALALATGCSAKFQTTNMARPGDAPVRLDRALPVVVAVPADGGYGDKITIGSGFKAATRTVAVFARYAPSAHLEDVNLRSRDEELAEARREGAGYLAIPTIVVWEPRFTPFTGHRSHVVMQLVVVDVASGQAVSSVSLEGYSRKVSLARTRPEGLLPHLVGSHVAVLYGAAPPPEQDEEKEEGTGGQDEVKQPLQ